MIHIDLKRWGPWLVALGGTVYAWLISHPMPPRDQNQRTGDKLP